jgi:M-phase inducer phosphatase
MDLNLISLTNSPSRLKLSDENLTVIVQNHDGSSMDSGYSTSCGQLSSIDDGKHCKGFKFLPPCGIPPRKLELSPMRKMTSPKNTFKISTSGSSSNSPPSDMDLMMEDDYLELFEMETLEDENTLPKNLKSLISGNIIISKTPETRRRPLARRSLSLFDSETTKNVRTSLFASDCKENVVPSPKTPESVMMRECTDNLTPFSSRIENARCFKRPEPPSENPIESKRCRSENIDNERVKRPLLRKSISMNDTVIMNALAKSSAESDLIGDFSRPYCLPLMDGRHQDLKSISVHTMAKLICGEFENVIGSFKVIDCRYPYEFEGGHIRGAANLYTQEHILDELVISKTGVASVEDMAVPKRNILIFHCEFSSERGPKLSRFLRNLDRSRNENAYPALHYPEIYLLNGGYKDFYETYADLCDPNSYRPMLHPSYMSSYKHFRAKSKSWNGDIRSTVSSTNRLLKSRSRLVL